MKSIIFLSAIFSLFLAGCSGDFHVVTLDTAPKNHPSDYWSSLAKSVLRDTKIPGTNTRKVDHSYKAGVMVNKIIDSESFLDERGADALIISQIIKEDNFFTSLIYTDDFEGLKKWLEEN